MLHLLGVRHASAWGAFPLVSSGGKSEIFSHLVSTCVLVQRAEREIMKANPPKKRGPRTDNFVLQENEIAPSLIRNIRHAHVSLRGHIK